MQIPRPLPTIKTIVEHEFPVWSGSRSAAQYERTESVSANPLNKLLLFKPQWANFFLPPPYCCYYRLTIVFFLFPFLLPLICSSSWIESMSTIPKYSLFVYLSFHQMIEAIEPPFLSLLLDRCNFRFLDHFKWHIWQAVVFTFDLVQSWLFRRWQQWYPFDHDLVALSKVFTLSRWQVNNPQFWLELRYVATFLSKWL